MALTIINNPGEISKIYDKNIFEINETLPVNSYLIEVFLNADVEPTAKLRKIAIGSSNLTFDIQYTLQAIIDFKDNLSTPLGVFINDLDYDQSPLPYYHIKITAYLTNDTTENVSSSNLYLLNGSRQNYYGGSFGDGTSINNINDYIIDSPSITGNTLLSDPDVNREVSYDNNTFTFSYLRKDGTDRIADYLKLTTYDTAGVVATSEINIPVTGTSISVITYNISPIKLGIGNDIVKYMISNRDGENAFQPIIINMIDNTIFDPISIGWINSEFGVLEEYTFMLNRDYDYDIDRDDYLTNGNFNTDNNITSTIDGDFYQYTKQFNITVEEEIEVVSNYMCSNMSNHIKNLWYSPYTYHNNYTIPNTSTNRPRPIIVNDNSITPLNRVGGGLLQSLSFKYADGFNTQKK